MRRLPAQGGAVISAEGRISWHQAAWALATIAAVLLAWGDLKSEMKSRLALLEYRVSLVEQKVDGAIILNRRRAKP